MIGGGLIGGGGLSGVIGAPGTAGATGARAGAAGCSSPGGLGNGRGSGIGSGGGMSPPTAPSLGTRNGCKSSAVRFNTRTMRGVSVRMMSVSVVSVLLWPKIRPITGMSPSPGIVANDFRSSSRTHTDCISTARRISFVSARFRRSFRVRNSMYRPRFIVPFIRASGSDSEAPYSM